MLRDPSGKNKKMGTGWRQLTVEHLATNSGEVDQDLSRFLASAWQFSQADIHDEVPRRQHPGWLNQVEIHFSVVQRKVLTPNNFDSLLAVKDRLIRFQTCNY